jgi:hypothetical protein
MERRFAAESIQLVGDTTPSRGDLRNGRESVAGVAVQFAPCSARFPCYQGILQGILQNRAIWEHQRPQITA